MTRRVVGLVLTVAVAVGLAAGMFLVLGGAPGCAESEAACPSTFVPGLGLLFAAVLLSFVAMALGAVECFPVLFLAIGFGALLAVPGAAAVDRAFPAVFGTGFVGAGLVSTWLLWRMHVGGDTS